MRNAIFLLFLLAAAPAAAQDRSADERALREFKTELWPRSYREGDEALLDRLLASEFQMIGADGVVSNKAEEMAYVAGKQPDGPGRSFRFEIERLDMFENGTAVVSGTGHVSQPKQGGGAQAFRYRSSNILIKRDGRWQAIASHVSGVTNEK